MFSCAYICANQLTSLSARYRPTEYLRYFIHQAAKQALDGPRRPGKGVKRPRAPQGQGSTPWPAPWGQAGTHRPSPRSAVCPFSGPSFHAMASNGRVDASRPRETGRRGRRGSARRREDSSRLPSSASATATCAAASIQPPERSAWAGVSLERRRRAPPRVRTGPWCSPR
jgi:hypothetical protein